PNWDPPKLNDYPMLNDLQVSFPASTEIHFDWESANPQTSPLAKGADKFLSRWIEKTNSFERKNKILQAHGENEPVQHGAPDLFIVVFREENIAVGQWYEKLMTETFGKGRVANIKLV